MAFNSPKFEGGIKRFVHSPITTEHNGIKISIKENGRVLIVSRPELDPETNEMDWDEVEVPASLIFKIATLLSATRRVEMVEVTEIQK